MIVDEVEYRNWSEILSKCLQDLKVNNPSKSETSLAESIGLSRATFNRIKNDQKLPRLDNVIKIIIGSGNIEFLSKALSFHSEDLGNSIGKVLEVALKEKQKTSPSIEIQKKLKDPDYFIVYLLCSISKGVTPHLIKEIVGTRSACIIKDLLERDAIFFHNGKYHLKKMGITIRSFEDFHHHLPTYSKYYQPSHVGKERNYCHSLTDGLNEMGIKEIRKAHKNFHLECQNILRNSSYHGDIPYFSVAFCDSMTALPKNREV
tara:strand:+ start:3598 stop:4380 length:783 start_codon:yes stop_codon:yes gene_type:complete